MTRPDALLAPLPQANRIFVNRANPLELADKKLDALRGRQADLLVFYGVGGQGKTWLCNEILARFKARSDANLKLGLLDLASRADKKQLDGRMPMLWVRNALASNKGVSFPAFDLGYALYWQLLNPEQQAPSFEGAAWLSTGEDLASAGVAQHLAALIKESIEAGMESLPVVAVLKRLATWGLKGIRRQYTLRTNEAVRGLFDENLSPLPVAEVERKLPLLLAADLEEAIEKHPETRFVLLIDEYERVIEQGGLGSPLHQSAFDEAMRTLMARAPALFALIFSRERLPWAYQPPEGVNVSSWKSWIESAHHLLGGLSVADADQFLAAIPIDDAAVRDAMIDGALVGPRTENAAVYPLMLDLQVGIYLKNLDANGRLTLPPESFRTAAKTDDELRLKLLKRLLRDYGPAAAMIKRLAVPRWFNRDLFLLFARSLPAGVSIDQFPRLRELSFVQDGGSGQLTIHRIVRESLIEMLDAEDRAEAHRLLAGYYEERAKVDKATAVSREHLIALREAIYHRSCLELAAVPAWWSELRESYFERPAVGAVTVVERELLDTLSVGLADHSAWLPLLLEHVSTLTSHGRSAEALRANSWALELVRGRPDAAVKDVLAVQVRQAELLLGAGRTLEAELITDELSDSLERSTQGDLAQLGLPLRRVIVDRYLGQGKEEDAEQLTRSMIVEADAIADSDYEPRVVARLMLLRLLCQQERDAEADVLSQEIESIIDSHLAEPTDRLHAYGTVALHYFAEARLDIARRFAAAAARDLDEKKLPDELEARADFFHVGSYMHLLLKQTEQAVRFAKARVALIDQSAAHTDADLVTPLLELSNVALLAGDAASSEAAYARMQAVCSRLEDVPPDAKWAILRYQHRVQMKQHGLSLSAALELNGALLAAGGIRTAIEEWRQIERAARDQEKLFRAIVLLALAHAQLLCFESGYALAAAQLGWAILEREENLATGFVVDATAILATAYVAMGEQDEARALHDRLRAFLEAPADELPFGPRMRGLLALAESCIAQARWADAAGYYARMLGQVPPEMAAQIVPVLELLQSVAQARESREIDARWERLAPEAIARLGSRHPLAGIAQEFLCLWLGEQKRPEELARARMLHAEIRHALLHSEHEKTRRALRDAAEALVAIGKLQESIRWWTKATRGYDPEEGDVDWFAQTECSTAWTLFRCGLADEADERAVVLVDLVAFAGAEPRIDALALRARIAIVRGDLERARAFALELDALTRGLPERSSERANGLRRLTGTYAHLADYDPAARVAEAARNECQALWPDVAWVVPEIWLQQTHAAYRAGRLPEMQASVEQIDAWLSVLRVELHPADPRAGELLLRTAGPIVELGDPERGVSMLREGMEIIRRACGDHHFDLKPARALLGQLLKSEVGAA